MRRCTPDSFGAEFDGTFVELKTGLNAVRNLRAALMDLAYAVHDLPNRRGLLVLAEPRISVQRLEHEWALAERTLRPEIIERLGLVFSLEGRLTGYPREPLPSLMPRLKDFVLREQCTTDRNLPRPDYSAEIFKILVHQWLLGSGPITARRLGEVAGCTYPTVARVLDRLAPDLLRHSDRSCELKAFPKTQWAAFLARGDEVRHTIRFSDRSGQPRSPEMIVRRLAKLERKDIAVGGALGACGHFPALDLLGTPRVDLAIHCPSGSLSLDFIGHIDPALALSENREEPPALVLHVLRRKEAFFTTSATNGLAWADPVECLLDLHDARLEPQALEFYQFYAQERSPSL